jgi:hypothetical protein
MFFDIKTMYVLLIKYFTLSTCELFAWIQLVLIKAIRTQWSCKSLKQE